MYTYELRVFKKTAQIVADHIGSERCDAKFHQYKDNTLKAHIALDNADCLIALLMLSSLYDDQDLYQFADMAGWELHRNTDGVIVENY